MASRDFRTCLILHRLHLVMFCVIITNIWWNISNSHMAQGYSAFLWIFQKITLKLHCIENLENLSKPRRGRDSSPSSLLIRYNILQYQPTLKNNIYHLNKRGPPAFFYSDTNPVLGHVLVHSVDKTHVLVVTVELIWLLFLNILSFNFVPTPNKSLRFTRFRRSPI